MTPSQAHDGAYRRDAGHDEMQLHVFRWLLGRTGPVHLEDQEYRRNHIEAEMPLVVRGKIVCFVDVAEHFTRVDGKERFWRFFELKPRIETTGGLLRQVKTLQHLGPATLRSQGTLSGPRVLVGVIVPHGDPLAEAFETIAGFSVLQWDPEKGAPWDGEEL